MQQIICSLLNVKEVLEAAGATANERPSQLPGPSSVFIVLAWKVETGPPINVGQLIAGHGA